MWCCLPTHSWISSIHNALENQQILFAYINLLILGLTLFGLRQVGVLLTGSNDIVNFTVSSALLFGTICSAVDPVAVSMPRLYMYMYIIYVMLIRCSLHVFPALFAAGIDEQIQCLW